MRDNRLSSPALWLGRSDSGLRYPSPATLLGAAERFPEQTPMNKEEYYYRSVFEELFPSRSAALTVPSVPSVACSTAEALAWDEAFRNLNDPSGRAVKGVHADSY